jgi:ATP-dependent protease Clp ATPase subunit
MDPEFSQPTTGKRLVLWRLLIDLISTKLVDYLNDYVIGQPRAKKILAVAYELLKSCHFTTSLTVYTVCIITTIGSGPTSD